MGEAKVEAKVCNINYLESTCHLVIFNLIIFYQNRPEENVTNCRFPRCGNRVLLRKDVTTLTEEETRALQRAMSRAVDAGDFGKTANFHGAPLTMCDPTRDNRFRSGCCPHSNNADFLVWHRLLITNMDRVSEKSSS